MALNYHEVMTTDLGLLTTAAGKWDSMAAELNKVETRYGETVQKITMGDTWSGVSAGTAEAGFKATRYEYAAAQTQAKAIASLLRDAHTQFADLKKKLESARDDAIAAGMSVSEQGRVAFDWSKLTPAERSAYHHDPDGQKTIGEAVAKWQKHIDDRVKAVDELDQNVKLALSFEVVDSNKDAFGKGADATFNGFNAGAEGKLDDAVKHAKAMQAAMGGDGKSKEKPDDDGLTFTGPDAGFSISGTKYGKEGSVKAYADFWHATAEGSKDVAGVKLSGIADVYDGARATANWGLSEKGLTAKAEASVGLRALAEGRAEYGPGSLYVRGEGFAGAELGGNIKVHKDEVTAGFKAFAGAKGTVAGGTEVGGIGVGLTAEGWAGPGAEGWWGYKRDESGKFHLGGKVGASPILGGSVGLEITVDPAKVSKAAGEVADGLGDAAHAVGDGASGAYHTVKGWFD
ncbi:hypothetical protein AB0953_11275 [Streptomyces sp. NPDC046866]|uniref:hypothetical protein n=1 Tax=Streptomyces sp. NPDC046866 TaxID=3154921 RepID=UPI003451CFC7